MPTLPRLNSQGGLPSPAPTPIGPDVFGGQAFEAITHLGEVQTRLQDFADRTEATRSVLEAQQEFKGIIQKNQDSIVDDKEFEETTAREVREAHAARLKAAKNPHVRQLVGDGLSDNLIGANTLIRGVARKKLVDTANANFIFAEDELTNKAIAAPTPEARSRVYLEFGTLIGGRMANGLSSQESAAKAVLNFRHKVELGAMRIMEPTTFIARHEAGEFNHLPAEDVLKVAESMRKRVERDESRQTEIFRDLKAIAINNIHAAANRGDIRDSEMEDMLAGRHPYVTATEARRLQEINNSPPLAEGREQVDGIMEQYASGPSTFERIARARAEINLLRKSQIKPNKAIKKALDELQTDERTMTGIEASRVNRNIQSAQDQYEIENPKPPIRIPGLDNKRDRDKAKIRESVRKGQDPKGIIGGSVQSTKKAEDNARTKHGRALNW